MNSKNKVLTNVKYFKINVPRPQVCVRAFLGNLKNLSDWTAGFVYGKRSTSDNTYYGTNLATLTKWSQNTMLGTPSKWYQVAGGDKMVNGNVI